MSETKEQKDEFCLRLIHQTTSSEVLSWLQNYDALRTLGELESREESLQLVMEIFEAGAIQVFAVEIDCDEDEENTGKLCIELPDEPISRKCVLDWTGQIAKQQGSEQELDVGQQYVFMMLD